MTMKTIYLVVIVCAFAVVCHAQTSIVQDAKGETSLALGSSNVIAVNTSEKSIAFSYGGNIKEWTPTDGRRRWYIGATAKNSTKDNISNIVKDGKIKLKGELGPFINVDLIPNDNFTWSLYGSVLPSFNRYDVYDETQAFDSQIKSKSYLGVKTTLGGNGFYAFHKNATLLFGLSINTGIGDNTADLATLEVSDIVVVNSGTSMRQVKSNVKNPYDAKTYHQQISVSNFNADLGLQIFKRYSAIFSPRISAMAIRHPQFNPALGIYLSQDSSPLDIVAGLQVQTLDWFNTADSDKSRGARTVLNAVAGYVF